MVWLFILKILAIATLPVAGLLIMFIITNRIAKSVYNSQLVRDEEGKWKRVCSAPDNEEQLEMWNNGMAWADLNRDKMTEVSIENEGLKLFGEYYDFGSDRCVVILPGRTECLIYSYYFAEPYQKAGMNVLVIDQRAHGNSDGKYNTLGVAESRDLKVWLKYVEEKFNIKEFYFHSICVGSSTALLTATAPDCPKSVKGIIAEGCYVSFRETFKQHMIDINRPRFPVLDLVMRQIRIHTGTSTRKTAPIKIIKKYDKRILFLFGEKDIFSLPEKSKELYAACASDKKEIVWFEKGGHSHLRINNTEKYDKTIADFIGAE